jgi:hypothetical protein
VIAGISKIGNLLFWNLMIAEIAIKRRINFHPNAHG